MKSILTCLLAIAAICLIGACDSHPWSETQGLHEPYQKHAGHEGGEHAEAAGNEHAGAAPAAKAAAEHEKK